MVGGNQVTTEPSIEQLDKEIAELKKDITNLEKEIASLEKEIAKLGSVEKGKNWNEHP